MSNRGVTLLELALVLVLLGILSGIAAPRLVAWQDRMAVEAASATTRSMLDETRATAITLARAVELRTVSGILTMSARIDTTVTVMRERPLDPSISVSGLDRPIGFGAHGLAIGSANRTITIQRGRIVREIVLSRLGRIR